MYKSSQNCNISIIELFEKLYNEYGPRNWWPAKTKFEIMAGAVLTQNTSWSNVEKAICNFGDRLSPYIIENISLEELIDIIKPSGFYNQKAKTLKLLCKWFSYYDYDFEKIKQLSVDRLRNELLSIKGIGNETADSIILYAIEKPIFVIDAYTIRILARWGIDLPEQYDQIRILVEKSIESFISQQQKPFCRSIFINLCTHQCNTKINVEDINNCKLKIHEIKCIVYNEFHALIVEHAKKYCTKKPNCGDCFIRQRCKYFNIYC